MYLITSYYAIVSYDIMVYNIRKFGRFDAILIIKALVSIVKLHVLFYTLAPRKRIFSITITRLIRFQRKNRASAFRKEKKRTFVTKSVHDPRKEYNILSVKLVRFPRYRAGSGFLQPRKTGLPGITRHLPSTAIFLFPTFGISRRASRNLTDLSAFRRTGNDMT